MNHLFSNEFDSEKLKTNLAKNGIMGITMEGCLNLDYYNARVVTWEPAIEPSSFAVGFLSSKVGSNNKSSKEVGVEIEHFKVNVTDACLEVLGVILADRGGDQEHEGSEIKSMKKTALTAGIAAKLARNKDKGYTIKNRTGYEIYILTDGGKNLGKTIEKKIERGGEAKFDLEKSEGEKGAANSS
ncbi:hypothetical protein TL16_g07707 [Triparma laevis f. inornata]|uniref:Uncharacterized protein n=1 Tax=Triparma laevis f. inornata TaxID=1714386 RepID=A0A9W7AS61_9STRA|nr:hypothetical protein TL16_g07707 [Triparma laevis f. inornata]